MKEALSLGKLRGKSPIPKILTDEFYICFLYDIMEILHVSKYLELIILLNCCLLDEGAYFSTAGKKVKDATIRWGEPPHSVGEYLVLLLLPCVDFTMKP